MCPGPFYHVSYSSITIDLGMLPRLLLPLLLVLWMLSSIDASSAFPPSLAASTATSSAATMPSPTTTPSQPQKHPSPSSAAPVRTSPHVVLSTATGDITTPANQTRVTGASSEKPLHAAPPRRARGDSGLYEFAAAPPAVACSAVSHVLVLSVTASLLLLLF